MGRLRRGKTLEPGPDRVRIQLQPYGQTPLAGIQRGDKLHAPLIAGIQSLARRHHAALFRSQAESAANCAAYLAAVTLVTSAAAQQGSSPALNRPRVAGTHFEFGYAKLDVAALNAAFTANGFPTLPSSAFTIGGGGYLTFGRLTLGGSGHRVLPRARTTGGFRNEVSGGYGLFDAGVAIIARDRTKLFPVVGVGVGRTVSKLAQTTALPFDSVLANPLRGTEMRGRTWLLHVGLNLDQVVSSHGQFALGLSGGYIFRGGSTTWRVDRNALTGAPNAGYKGAYVRITIGAALGSRFAAVVPSIFPVMPYLFK